MLDFIKDNLKISDLISATSALIALIAMGVTVWQTIINKKIFNLEKKKFEEEKPNFEIIDYFDSKAIINNSKKITLKFFLVIANRSIKNTTIKNIYLRVIGEEKNIILTPINKPGLLFIGDNIDGNQSVQKWVEFEIESDNYYNLDIIEYKLEIEDINKNKHYKTIIYLEEEVKCDE